MTVVRFRLVEKNLAQNVATLWMYGPGPRYYTEFDVPYAGTFFEDVPLGASLSFEEFITCLQVVTFESS